MLVKLFVVLTLVFQVQLASAQGTVGSGHDGCETQQFIRSLEAIFSHSSNYYRQIKLRDLLRNCPHQYEVYQNWLLSRTLPHND